MAIVLITGGAGGIGRALAQKLVERGDVPVLADLDPARVREAAAQLEGATGLALDVTSPEDCERAVQATVAQHGRLDGVVCCAGVLAGFAPAEAFPSADFERTLAVNLHGAFFTCQAAARAMIAAGHGGSMVLVSSGMAMRAVGWPDDGGRTLVCPAYGASKAAVEAVTRELAVGLADQGIRVNAVSPGMFDTDMSAEAREDPTFLAWYRAHTPLGRTGDPAELASVIAFLLTDSASYMTGSVVPVEGGFLSV